MVRVVKNRFEKARSAFFSVVILGFALSFILAACNSNPDELPPEEKPEEKLEEPTIVQRQLGSEQIFALAVFRVFDGNGKSSSGVSFKSSSQNITRFNTSSIKYDFDFVEVYDAFRFFAPKIDFPFLNEICGDDEIEVFLTPFTTWVYDERENLEPFISDTLIVFRGELGIYSCMLNSGSSEPGLYEMVFSSHKRFGKDAIEKDFTPPVYEFSLKMENSFTLYSLGCKVMIDKDGNFTNQSFQWTTVQGGDFVSSNHLFSPDELTLLPETSQLCTITGIGADYFLVSGEHNLEVVHFDEHTLFFAGKDAAKSTDFAVNDVITVTFYKLYDRHNPKIAFANKIVK